MNTFSNSDENPIYKVNLRNDSYLGNAIVSASSTEDKTVHGHLIEFHD